MNTPRTKKPTRFDAVKWRADRWRLIQPLSGSFDVGLTNPNVATLVGSFIAAFNDLEELMERFAAIIIGCEEDVAKHVMRSIMSAKARTDMLRNALERGRANHDRSEDFDLAISEFKAINSFRNDLAHAKYQTNCETGAVLWIPPNDDPLLLASAALKAFKPRSVTQMAERMKSLRLLIWGLIDEEEARRAKRHPQP